MDMALKEMIDAAEYVSFDIYDTLIKRQVSDLFLYVGEQYKKQYGALEFEYVQQRLLCGEKAFHNLHSDIEENTLEEIYICLKETGIHELIIDRLMQLEIEAEVDISMRNDFIHKAFSYCLEKGKKIIIISDMYLPTEVIVRILEKNSYKDYLKLYLSSEIGLKKATGSIFKYVINDLGCAPSAIIHIGDNIEADIKMAISCGLTAYHYK